ncbi:MAG: hypothetical protein GY870_12660 [archaeon]|nr:hypothetical protein [archaeon]
MPRDPDLYREIQEKTKKKKEEELRRKEIEEEALNPIKYHDDTLSFSSISHKNKWGMDCYTLNELYWNRDPAWSTIDLSLMYARRSGEKCTPARVRYWMMKCGIERRPSSDAALNRSACEWKKEDQVKANVKGGISKRDIWWKEHDITASELAKMVYDDLLEWDDIISRLKYKKTPQPHKIWRKLEQCGYPTDLKTRKDIRTRRQCKEKAPCDYLQDVYVNSDKFLNDILKERKIGYGTFMKCLDICNIPKRS